MFTNDVDNALRTLLKESKNICFIENSQIEFSVRVYIDIYSCFFPRNLASIIIDCISSGKNSAYISLGIDNEDKSNGHANALIFNYINNVIEIERYEPHGASGSYTSFIDQYLIKLLIEDFSKFNYKIKYFTPLEYCPYFGAQTHARDTVGYCVIFSAMYVFDRSSHPEMTRNQIADMYTKKEPSLVLKETEDFLVLLDSIPKIDFFKIGNYINNPKKYEFKGFFPTEKFLDSKSNKFVRTDGPPLKYVEYYENIPQEYIQDLDNTSILQAKIQSEMTQYSSYQSEFWKNEVKELERKLNQLNSRIIRTVATEESTRLFTQEYEKLKNEQTRIILEKQKLSQGKFSNVTSSLNNANLQIISNVNLDGMTEKDKNAYLTAQNNIRLEKLGVKKKLKVKQDQNLQKNVQFR